MTIYACPKCGSEEVLIAKTVLVEQRWGVQGGEQSIIEVHDQEQEKSIECSECGASCDDIAEIDRNWM